MALIHYYQGSMYAGKSTAAVNTLLQAPHYQERIIISPSWHARGFLSRNHGKNEINEEELTILPDLDALDFHVIASPIKRLLVIDEVQFCPKEKLIQLLEMSNTSEHLDLIVAGLQVGQHGQPFANNALLLPYFANKMTIIHAPCALCQSKEGLVAVRKWLIDDHIRDEYSLLCKSCFDKFFAYGRGSLPIPDPLFDKNK